MKTPRDMTWAELVALIALLKQVRESSLKLAEAILREGIQ